MNILQITGHLGGGVGTVICDWMKNRGKKDIHVIASLDTINKKAGDILYESGVVGMQSLISNRGGKYLNRLIVDSDIVLLHYWPHPMIKEFISRQLPPCRLLIWSHHNSAYSPEEIDFPDLFLGTSPIQGHERFIWSTGDISRFLEIEPKPHNGFNIGYVGTIDYKKIHPAFVEMCRSINIPDVRFLMIGENKIGRDLNDKAIFAGKVDDVAPYLADIDIFGYPLSAYHYGTCEQALGEAMAAGVVPVVMDNPAERKIVKAVMLNGLRAKTPEDYVRCIELLYHDPDLRRIMSHNARSSAKALYDIQTMIGYWNETFDEVMRKYPKRERKPIP